MSTSSPETGPHGSPDEVPIGYLLKQTQQALRAVAAEALRPHGLTLAQFAVLVALKRTPGLSNAELARSSFIAPQSMAELLGGLEAAGLLTRRPSPTHGRVLEAVLTPGGLETLQAVRPVMDAVEARLLAGLAPHERRELRGLLERCTASLCSVRSPQHMLHH